MHVTLDLPTPLTPDQLEKKNAELASKTIELDAVAAKKRAACSDFNITMKDLRKSIQELAQDCTSKTTLVKDVPCEERAGLTNGTIDVFRMDLGEPGVGVFVKQITEGEKHGPLFEGASAKAKKGGRKKKADAQQDLPTTPVTEEELSALATGEPGIGIGTDGLEYELTAEQADLVRTGKDVPVQGIDGTGEQFITKLKSREGPAKVSTRKSRGRGQAEVLQ